MSKEIEKCKVLSRDSVNHKEKDLADMVDVKIKELQSYFDVNVDDMM